MYQKAPLTRGLPILHERSDCDTQCSVSRPGLR
jgi:hypothetical protein